MDLFHSESPGAARLRSLATQLQGGLPLSRALGTFLGGPDAARSLPEGARCSTILGRAGHLDRGEEALLRAFEETGQLAQGLLRLARTREERHRALRKTLGRLVMPLLMVQLAIPAFHIGFLLPPRPWGMGSFLTSSLLFLFLIDGALLLLARQVTRAWRRGTIAGWPLVGRWYENLEKERALAILEATHAAGLLWDQAVALASDALTAPALKYRLAGVQQAITQCGEPGDLLSTALDLPDYCRGFLVSGGQAGELEEGLAQCRRALDREASSSQDLFFKGFTTLLFIGQVAFVLAVVFHIFSKYILLLTSIK